MLDFDFRSIGGKLLQARARMGITQAEAAERAGISDRTYADIERGTVNMRVETLLRICEVMKLSPNDLLTEEKGGDMPDRSAIWTRLESCTAREQETALRLLEVYLTSIDR